MRALSFVFLISCFLSQSLWAAVTPHQRITEVTENLLQVIDEGKGYFEKEPERFYGNVDALIDPLIDFPSFTRSVMGDFGTRDYYTSLNADEKQQFKADYKRFVAVFKGGLIQTYAKGLLAFSGEKISVVPATQEDQALIAKGETVVVKQEIQGKDKAYVVGYKMRPNKAGDWLVRNVTIDSVNVGQLYQNQFLAAMKKQNNNFSKVIDNWVIEQADLKRDAASK